MNLLDELKRKAEKLRNDQEQADNNNSGMHLLRSMHTVAALQSIHQYLHELVALLNEIQLEIQINLELEILGKLENLTQGNYHLYQESSHQKEIVRLIFSLQSESVLEFQSEDNPLIKEQVTRCKKQGLIVSYLPQNPLHLSIQGYVPVTIEFYSDFSDANIHVFIQNFTNIGNHRCLLSCDNVNENMLNQLGDFLLRRPNKFLDLLAEDTSIVSGTYPTVLSAANAPTTAHQTEELDASRLRRMLTGEQRLYLTYHNNIKDLSSRVSQFIIGRAKDSDLVVNSDLASRYHAKIVFRNGKFVISDQSTNGTFIKVQGGKEIYVLAEQVPLTGSGFISLGKSVTVDNENLIYYSCQ